MCPPPPKHTYTHYVWICACTDAPMYDALSPEGPRYDTLPTGSTIEEEHIYERIPLTVVNVNES